MTFQQWQGQHGKMRDMARRVADSRRERARQLAVAAGLDSDIAFIHIHNALVDLHYGRPWRGVDYSLVRQARRVERSMFDGYDIIERWDNRVWPDVLRNML